MEKARLALTRILEKDSAYEGDEIVFPAVESAGEYKFKAKVQVEEVPPLDFEED